VASAPPPNRPPAPPDPGVWGPEPSPTAVALAVSRGKAIVAEAERALPADWGQAPDGARLPGVDEIRGAYPGTDLAFAVWMTSASVDLGGITPREALIRGQRARVLAVAGALGLSL
jgi:hypothetical protein